MGQVVGYPGDWNTTMAEDSGKFVDVSTRSRGQYTGQAISYDLDTAGGNSGGPIFSRDPTVLNALRSEFGFAEDADDDLCLIGVHTYGANPNNGGTLLTPELMQWTLSKLKANLDLASKDVSQGQTGSTSRGSDNWRPQKPSGNSGSSVNLDDLVSISVRQTNGEITSVDGVLSNGKRVRLTLDQWDSIKDQYGM